MALAAGPGRLLADVQVTALGATQSLQSISGTTNTEGSGTVQMTPNSVNTTQPATNQVWDITRIEVFPGVLKNGITAPDLEMWVEVDSADYSGWFRVDCGQDTNMLPRRQETYGGKFTQIGRSLLTDAYAVSQGASRRKNMPSLYTGIKVGQDLVFWFRSVAGFTADDWIQYPTVRAYGDVYDSTLLGFISRNLPWDPTINETSKRRELAGMSPYTGNNGPAGAYTLSNFTQRSGGGQQLGTTAQRFMKRAYNAAQVVPGTDPYVLSTITQNGLGGQSGNVVAGQNLGWAYTNSGNGLKILELGRRPGQNAQTFGFWFGAGVMYPQELNLGVISTYAVPRVPCGTTARWDGVGNQYYILPEYGSWTAGDQGPEVIAGETVALAVAAHGGNIAANDDFTAVGGVAYFNGTYRQS